MQLESVTAELRPRSEWEAVDLGLAMVRRDFWALAGAWWIGMIPVVAIALPFLHAHPGWFCVVFWWAIPLASRLALFRMSRHLFGEKPNMKDVMRHFPAALKCRFFYRFFWARFSPWRPLSGSVEMLEGLTGKAFRKRCLVLMRRGDSSLSILAMWKVLLTPWLALTIFATAGLFVPESISARWSEVFQLWFDGDSVEPPLGLSLAMLTSACLAMFLVDLFAVGAGFGIYLNHRTWVEGWDVELAFRRLSNRLGETTKKVTAALLVIGLLGFSSPPAMANPERAEDKISEIIRHEDFKEHTATQSHYEPTWELDGGSPLGFMEVLLTLIKFLVIGGVIALVVFLLYRYRHVFLRGKGTANHKPERETATVVMGMQVTRDSLPENVVEAARRAWRDGHHHEAMSLLYRAALAWMIHSARVPIEESDTESDCLRRVDDAHTEHARFFATLTHTWIALAYGKREPSDIDQLFDHWPFHAPPTTKGVSR